VLLINGQGGIVVVYSFTGKFRKYSRLQRREPEVLICWAVETLLTTAPGFDSGKVFAYDGLLHLKCSVSLSISINFQDFD
jgi:hypothetical protein